MLSRKQTHDHVLADPGKRANRRDTKVSQGVGWPDPGRHQELRAAETPAARMTSFLADRE